MFRASTVSSRRHAPVRTAARRAAAVLIEPVERRTLMSAGALDPTFGTSGVLAVHSIQAVDASGRFLETASSSDKSGFHGTLTRLLPNGTVDTTFGVKGTASFAGVAIQVSVEPSGKILLVVQGSPQPGGGELEQLTSTGQLDTTFGTGGTVSADLIDATPGPNATIYALDPDNEAVHRFTASGQPDSAFGTAGQVPLSAAAPPANGYILLGGFSLGVDSAGRPVVAAVVEHYSPTGGTSPGVVRFTTTGAVDQTFGIHGLAVGGPSYFNYQTGQPLAIAPDGTVYVAGVSIDDAGTNTPLLNAFGSNGKSVSGGAIAASSLSESIDNVDVDAFGRPIVTATEYDTSGAAAAFVERLNPITVGGSPGFDPTFGASGSVQLPGKTAFNLMVDRSGNLLVSVDAGTVRVLTAGPSSVTPVAATGTVIGSAGSYASQGNTVAKAFDGNLNTFYDAAHATGDWAGLDLGAAAKPVVQIQFAPRAGWAARMVGGQFQVSTTPDFSSNVQTIYTVTAAPAVGTLTTVAVGNVGAYRYARYLGPAGSYGNVAEVRFLVAGATELTGTVIGTAGSYGNQGNTIANAFDGNLNTFVDGPTANGNSVGLDLGTAIAVTQVRFAPRAGFAARMVGGTIQASNTADFSSGVVTAYTITTAPPVGSLTTVSLANVGAYRYWRYVGPAGSYGNIADLEFDA